MLFVFMYAQKTEVVNFIWPKNVYLYFCLLSAVKNFVTITKKKKKWKRNIRENSLNCKKK